jgi:hypothetical protein
MSEFAPKVEFGRFHEMFWSDFTRCFLVTWWVHVFFCVLGRFFSDFGFKPYDRWIWLYRSENDRFLGGPEFNTGFKFGPFFRKSVNFWVPGTEFQEIGENGGNRNLTKSNKFSVVFRNSVKFQEIGENGVNGEKIWVEFQEIGENGVNGTQQNSLREWILWISWGVKKNWFSGVKKNVKFLSGIQGN